jgi:aspartate carbamoyltransferase catalytic subunit
MAKCLKDLINISDLSKDQMFSLFTVADSMKEILDKKQTCDLCKGKILATLFYEPSTRTRLSFESAMMRLGGSVLGFSSALGSSVSKGESLADTIRTVAGYSDIITLRHPNEGSARVASQFSHVPIINAGDGGHQHPTQCLLDLFTIRKEKGKFENLKVLISGDLKFGRTTHSLAIALARLGAELYFASPPGLEMPDYITNQLKKDMNVVPSVSHDLKEYIGLSDVLYMTRVQRERLGEMEYLKYRGSYVLSEKTMEEAKKDTIILHPLPRVDEITTGVDKDPRALYFQQAYNGIPVRMALIAMLLGVA